MSNAIAIHHSPSAGLVPNNMSDAIRLAEMMAQARLVPTHLQAKPGDCLLVIEQAMRWHMSPFAVAQSTSVISGKLCFEGKLVAAAIQASGVLEGRLDYEFTGHGDARTVKITGKLRGDPAPKSMEIVLKDVKTTNGMWTKQPDQQLVYSANRNWARRFCPEVMMGVYSPDEFDVPQQHIGQTLEHQPAIAALPAREEPTENAVKKPTVNAWLDTLERQLDEAASPSAVEVIVSRLDVQSALDKLTNGALTRLKAAIRTAEERFHTDDDRDVPHLDDAA